MQEIKHGSWKFDYIPGKHIYSITSDNISENYFKNPEGDLSNDINKLQVSLDDYRKAAVIHKLVREGLKNMLHDGVKYLDIANEADRLVKKYNSNLAFPLGISVNEVIAHDTAMIDDDRIIKKNDIVKIDLGIHINGSIIDSAFTVIIDGDEKTTDYYNPLLEATKDATYTGICLSGIDANLYDISTGIQEVIESYELDEKTPIKAVYGLGGHDILPYRVHGNKLILSVPNKVQENMRMEEGEVYAIETYASSGNGQIKQKELLKCNHFSINQEIDINNSMLKNPIVNWAINNNDGLPFTQRQVGHLQNCKKMFENALAKKIIIGFPPLSDNKGSYSSQFEHTIHIKDGKIELFSLGKDY